jgi:hypothetical protein
MMMTDVMTKQHQLIASDRVEGTPVRRPNGDKIGHIERLMIDKVSGKVAYAILSFGGFLGMGTSLLPLPWASPTIRRSKAYQLDIDDEELKRAVVRADKDFDRATAREAELHRITAHRRTGADSDRVPRPDLKAARRSNANFARVRRRVSRNPPVATHRTC